MRTVFPAVLALELASATCDARLAAAEGDGAEEDESRYGRRGSLEVGGRVVASWTDDALQLSLAPSFGLFAWDRIELSTFLAFTYSRIENPVTGATVTSKSAAAILEPSYHHPFATRVQAFAGLGVGAGWDGDEFDLQLIPRFGLNLVTARSSVITPALRVPLRIGDAYGDGGDAGLLIGIQLELGLTASW